MAQICLLIEFLVNMGWLGLFPKEKYNITPKHWYYSVHTWLLNVMFVNMWFNQCCSSSSEGKQNWTHNLDSCKQCEFLVTSEVIFSQHKRIIHMNIWFNQCCSSSSEGKQNWTHILDSCNQTYDSINVALYQVKGNRIGSIIWTHVSNVNI